MGWNGTHPEINREEAKRQLPAGACRMCVYRVQAFGGLDAMLKHFKQQWICPYCGVKYGDVSPITSDELRSGRRRR